MAQEKKLTKREQKAAAFKQKSKKKQCFTEETAVPEADDPKDVEPSSGEVKEVAVEKPKPKKATKIVVGENDDESEEQPPVVGTKRKQTEKPANKAKKQKDETQEKGARYIVFVGNLPYNTTKEELEKHFESVGGVTSVRLLTDKQTGKPKGFAFMEFESSKHLSKALAFHHTLFKKRQMNVELTAGGGGNKSNARKDKLKVKNERLQEERQKKHETIKGTETPGSSYGAKGNEE
ncbi:hypothetical protein CLU79DRAFT_731208 [Phycomyces nitens]|nr:hypothetical protein CLU79DRAFT_731208 [Phycomyces nitens]